MRRRGVLFIAATIVPVVVAGAVVLPADRPDGSGAGALTSCPAGYTLLRDVRRAERAASAAEHLLGRATDDPYDPANTTCVRDKHPESFLELDGMAAEVSAARTAPYGAVRDGARAAAMVEAAGLGTVGGQWQPAGTGVLHVAEEGYDSVNGLGLVEVAGRITDLEYVPRRNRLYASFGYGGIWVSTDKARTWRPSNGDLPTQVVGSVKHTSAGGRSGTLLALTGDNSYGRDSLDGLGAYWSADDGRTWTKAKGLPDGAFGFKLAVDRATPTIVYAATGTGLFRSTDAGRSYTNVALPTGDCAGRSNTDKRCIFANMVTDVFVQAPGGTTDASGHAVVAAVGWRAGNKANPDGTIQSPANGVYVSGDGRPGTFVRAGQGLPAQPRIGRIELGAAVGPRQNHDVLYAVVQDAQYYNTTLPTGGLDDLGLPVEIPKKLPTNLNGIYSSIDFGRTWVLMADGLELGEPQTGSSLAVVTPLLAAVGAGYQAWYNQFIVPDPTRQDPLLGIPTRIVFGLEEVWQNELPTPQFGKSQFKTIGRYYAGESCLFLSLGLPACPTDREDALDGATTTTHADQHAAVFIPEQDGGTTLVVGNDGGAFVQRAGPTEEFANTRWGRGANAGFNTLLPYHASMANDGTVWMGLQDNGTAKIDPKSNRIIGALGGDGFFTAVDPTNAEIAYGETPGAAMSVTTDGGRTWSSIAPPVTHGRFISPFVMDPSDAKHLLTAGREVVETTLGPATGTDGWKEVFDLGTRQHPGDPTAVETPTDPPNVQSALDLVGPNAYVAFCGPCDVLDQGVPFKSGIATNVGGRERPKPGTVDGWHVARAKGLPNRVVTSVAIDPDDPRTVYAALGGYERPWTPPGVVGDPLGAGTGHVYRSTDAGETFVDVSADLPDAPVWWVTAQHGRLVVATEVGVFIRQGATWKKLGTGLPPAYTRALTYKPDDANLLVAANYGRGVWTYRFGAPKKPARAPQVPEKRFKAGPKANVKVAGTFTFDVSDEGWTATSTTDAATWRRQPPGDTSLQAFAAVPYADAASVSLTSPRMTLPRIRAGAPYDAHPVTLSFSRLMHTEPDFDYLLVEWSSDAKGWKVAESFTGMNESFPAFDRDTVTFAAPPGSLYVRFRVSSDELISAPVYQGAVVDNVTVTR